MKPAAALLGLALLAATPASAYTPERAGMLVDALRANACSMTADEAPDALGPLGLDPIEVQMFVDVLYAAELVSISDDQQVLALSEPLCAATGDAAMAMIVAAFEAQEAELQPWSPDVDPETGALMVDAIRRNACAMSDTQAAETLPELGISPELSRDLVALLLDMELASISDDGFVLRLEPALCAANPAADAATIAAALEAWIADHTAEGSE